MAEHRPFPPSSRRLGLARRAGLTAASPQVVAAAAWGAAAIALAATARAAATAVGGWIATACAGADGVAARAALAAGGAALAPGAATTALASSGATTALGSSAATTALGSSGATTALAPSAATTALAPSGAALAPDSLAHAVLELALPVLTAIAAAALVAHLAQTRAPWLPRRKLAGAPAVDAGAMARTATAARELGFAVALGGVALGWLWAMAPRLARLPALAAADALPAAAALIASFLAAAAIAWLAFGALDALARWAAVAAALRMTDAERREDARLAAADPRWRARRESAARGPSAADAVAASAVVLLGDDAAVAIAWDARTRPIPTRLATGRRARATQLLGLARRHRIAVHRDAALADALADADGPVPERDWARLAEIVAATRR